MTPRAAFLINRTAYYIHKGMDLSTARAFALQDMDRELPSTCATCEPSQADLDHQKDHEEDQDGRYR